MEKAGGSHNSYAHVKRLRDPLGTNVKVCSRARVLSCSGALGRPLAASGSPFCLPSALHTNLPKLFTVLVRLFTVSSLFSLIFDVSWRVPGAVQARVGRQDEPSWQPRGTQWRVLAAKMSQVGRQEASKINTKSFEKSIEM